MGEKMLSLEEAQQIVLDHIQQTPVTDVVAWQAVGLPLAEDMTTDIDLSPFAASAMDGYAVRAQDLATASSEAPVSLEVAGLEAAGHVYNKEVSSGQAVRIMTGAPVPLGCNAVVRIEDVQIVSGSGDAGSVVSFCAPASEGQDVRAAGLEAQQGQTVMVQGEILTAAGAGLLASAGHEQVSVHRAPRVGIISLGTELVSPTCVPAFGQIRDANSAALLASALQAGAEPVFFGIAPDDEHEIRALVLRAAAECDFVITSGGASAGDFDFVTALVRAEGEVLFDRIAMRPGKAITFGILRGTPFLGLSGNPAAACVGFEMLARPALRAMRGYGLTHRVVQHARVSRAVSKHAGRRFYDRAVLRRDETTGELMVVPAASQNSALLGTLHKANCLMVVPEQSTGFAEGQEVACVRLDIPEDTVV